MTMKTTPTMRQNSPSRWFGRSSDALAGLGLSLAMLLASGAARAVGDLPGGPAVRQIDLHPPITRIA